MPIGVSEYGTMSVRVKDVEISVWKEYAFSSHYLAPTDGFHLVVGDEQIAPELWDLLRPGEKVQLFIDGLPQATGYIDVVDTAGDRNSGNIIQVEGRDVFAPLVTATIDPTQMKYPPLTPLSKLLMDTCQPFGFTAFFLDNEDNSNVAAGKAIQRPTKSSKKLDQYKLPRTKPQHGETYYDFLLKLVEHEGLHFFPTVDGSGIVVAKPDFDQKPRYELRRTRDGKANNIIAGGIRRDGTDQPSCIIATGNVPPSEHECSRPIAMCAHPLLPLAPIPAGTPTNFVETGPVDPTAAMRQRLEEANIRGPEKWVATYVQNEKYVATVPAPPVNIVNPFAPTMARPKFLKDQASHTAEQLANFAKRQMSLYLRRAFVARYTVAGHRIDGQVPQVDSVISIVDERSNWRGNMWIISRVFRKGRRGTYTEIEAVPLHSLTL